MSVWEQLLGVQAADSRIARLDHRRSQLPERARLEDIEDKLVAVRVRIEQAEGDKQVLVKEQRRIEDEISGIEDRIRREEEQLYGGRSSDPGHLQDLQDEIAGFKRRISALEDQELEILEQIEPIDARLTALTTEQRDLDAAAIETTTVLAESEASILQERDAAVAEREQAVAGIDADALRRYETVRDRLGGVAVARLESGSCGACHLKLSAVENDRILHLPVDEEVTCEECGRFLVRTA